MYALLRTIEYGAGCVDRGEEEEIPSPPGVPEATVADRESVEGCFICRSPVDVIDARSNGTFSVAANATDDAGAPAFEAVVVCGGDWRWTTDERRRSGWRSDEANSTVRFRVRVDSSAPTLSITCECPSIMRVFLAHCSNSSSALTRVIETIQT